MQTNFNYTIESSELEAQLVSAARAGKADDLIEYLYCKLMFRANRLIGMERPGSLHLEAEDLVQEAIEQVLANLGKGLERRNPVGWLLVAGWHRMTRYCMEFRSPIRVPKSSQFEGKRGPQVFSLDMALGGSEDLTLLDLIPAECISSTV
jgi:hypothetical protein